MKPVLMRPSTSQQVKDYTEQSLGTFSQVAISGTKKWKSWY